jgi:hypothetical protein
VASPEEDLGVAVVAVSVSQASVSESVSELSPDVRLTLRKAMQLAHCGDLNTGI